MMVNSHEVKEILTFHVLLILLFHTLMLSVPNAVAADANMIMPSQGAQIMECPFWSVSLDQIMSISKYAWQNPADEEMPHP